MAAHNVRLTLGILYIFRERNIKYNMWAIPLIFVSFTLWLHQCKMFTLAGCNFNTVTWHYLIMFVFSFLFWQSKYYLYLQHSTSLWKHLNCWIFHILCIQLMLNDICCTFYDFNSLHQDLIVVWKPHLTYQEYNSKGEILNPLFVSFLLWGNKNWNQSVPIKRTYKCM